MVEADQLSVHKTRAYALTDDLHRKILMAIAYPVPRRTRK